MSAASLYDPNLWDTLTPANVLGGRNRAIKALRDAHGRFMPNNEAERELWVLDQDHGRAGGLKVLEKYGRDYFKVIRAKRRSK